jgi:hypothetical protein
VSTDNLRERVRVAIVAYTDEYVARMGTWLSGIYIDGLTDAVLDALPQQWQSIETAPKDGTQILGFDAEIRVYAIIQWGKHNHIPLYGWLRQIELTDEAVEGFDATDWMPLPTPPKPGE